MKWCFMLLHKISFHNFIISWFFLLHRTSHTFLFMFLLIMCVEDKLCTIYFRKLLKVFDSPYPFIDWLFSYTAGITLEFINYITPWRGLLPQFWSSLLKRIHPENLQPIRIYVKNPGLLFPHISSAIDLDLA